MRGGQVQGAGSGRSPAACGGESRLRLLCSGEAGTGCAPARPPVPAHPRRKYGRKKKFL